jgi:hypothetical protein
LRESLKAAPLQWAICLTHIVRNLKQTGFLDELNGWMKLQFRRIALLFELGLRPIPPTNPIKLEYPARLYGAFGVVCAHVLGQKADITGRVLAIYLQDTSERTALNVGGFASIAW